MCHQEGQEYILTTIKSWKELWHQWQGGTGNYFCYQIVEEKNWEQTEDTFSSGRFF